MSNVVVAVSNSPVSVAAGAVETVNGDNDVITVGGYASLNVNGELNTINGSDDNLTINDAALLTNVVNGSYDKIKVPVNSHLTVNGTGEKIDDDGHGYLTLEGAAGSSDVVVGTVLELTAPAYFHLNFVGTQNNFYLGDHCSLVVAGDDDNLFGSDERLILSASTKGGDEIVGDRDRVYLSGTNSQLLLYGNDEVIHAGVGTSYAVMSGTNERFIGSGFYVLTTGATDVWMGGNGETGAANTLTGDAFQATLGANSNAVISGDDDTVSIGASTQLYLVGAGMTAHVGRNATLYINAKGETTALDVFTGSGFSINTGSNSHVEIAASNVAATLGSNVDFTAARSYDTITAGPSDTISILYGAYDKVVLATNDIVTDAGSKTTFVVNNQVGATKINGFAADHLGVVDIFSGIGGYATAADVAAALSVGADGSTLSLGIYGSLDFAGDTSLSAANFKIG